MKENASPESLSLSRAELLGLLAGSSLGGAALAGVIAFALERYGHVATSLAYAFAFVVLGVVLYVPLRIRQRSIGANLTFSRFVGAAGVGAIVVGTLTHFLQR